MGGIRLMNRTDTKFVTTEQRLMQLLQRAADDYYVQEIAGRRIASYFTLYFDTAQCDMFRAHHCGHLNRQKLRIRSYVDSDLDFLEVKTKNNHGRTKKRRIELSDAADYRNDRTTTATRQLPTGEDGVEPFLHDNLRYDTHGISGKIENRFRRITLVNKAKTERLTIDTGIEFHNLRADRRLTLDNVVIIELKRDGLQPSPILEMLRELRIKPMGFSKYCMGMAMTDDDVRRNRFMTRLVKIEKLRSITNCNT